LDRLINRYQNAIKDDIHKNKYYTQHVENILKNKTIRIPASDNVHKIASQLAFNFTNDEFHTIFVQHFNQNYTIHDKTLNGTDYWMALSAGDFKEKSRSVYCKAWHKQSVNHAHQSDEISARTDFIIVILFMIQNH